MSTTRNKLAPLIDRLAVNPEQPGKLLDSLRPVGMEGGEHVIGTHIFFDCNSHNSIVSVPTYKCQHDNIGICKHADMQYLHQRIKWALEKQGLKPIDLARECGINHASISQWMSEDYRGTVSAINLLKASERLKVRPRWLLTGEGPRDLSDAEIIDNEIRPIVNMLSTLPENVRTHFTLLIQDFMTAGLEAAGSSEGKRPYFEESGSHGQRDISRTAERAGKKKAG